MSKINLTIDKGSVKKLEAEVKRSFLEYFTKGIDALEQTARNIMAESQLEVPRETGTLASTGFVERRGNKVALGYGGRHDQINPKRGYAASEYMIIVHEDLNAHHDIGKAKFLEDPLMRNIANIQKNLINTMKEVK
jgi:hypothetical protein